MAEKKNTFRLLESINSSDRGGGTVPNMGRIQRITPDDLWTTVDLDDYSPVVDDAQVLTYSAGLTSISYLDIDHIPVYLEKENGRKYLTPESIRSANCQIFSRIFSLLHSNATGVRLGCKGLFPDREYQSFTNDDYNAIQLWRQYNEKNKVGANHADFVLPKVDAFTNDFADWQIYAISHFQESQRFCKSVFAFLEVKYNPDGDQGDTFIEAGQWTSMLELCLRYSDGIVIHGDSSINWATEQSAPWWTATQTFIASLQAA